MASIRRSRSDSSLSPFACPSVCVLVHASLCVCERCPVCARVYASAAVPCFSSPALTSGRQARVSKRVPQHGTRTQHQHTAYYAKTHGVLCTHGVYALGA